MSLLSDDDYIRLEPPRATLGELQLTNRLEMIRVEGDVLGVVERLKRIDPGLELLFDKRQEVYVLYHQGLGEDGQVREQLVGAYKALDQRIINLIERIDAQGRGRHDLAAELEKLERAKDRENDRRRIETVGPIAERLRHAIRKDMGLDGSQVFMGAKRGKRDSKRKRRR